MYDLVQGPDDKVRQVTSCTVWLLVTGTVRSGLVPGYGASGCLGSRAGTVRDGTVYKVYGCTGYGTGYGHARTAYGTVTVRLRSGPGTRTSYKFYRRVRRYGYGV